MGYQLWNILNIFPRCGRVIKFLPREYDGKWSLPLADLHFKLRPSLLFPIPVNCSAQRLRSGADHSRGWGQCPRFWGREDGRATGGGNLGSWRAAWSRDIDPCQMLIHELSPEVNTNLILCAFSCKTIFLELIIALYFPYLLGLMNQ